MIGTSSPASAGTEPLALIDAVLVLHYCLDAADTVPDSVEAFNELVQRVALLSANTPNASLRYQAHLVTKSILASHPDRAVRLAYIKDTLAECPYDNLKASAVGWLKDEILADRGRDLEVDRDGVEKAEVASPVALTALLPYLLIDPRTLINEEDYTSFLAHQGFFLAGTYSHFIRLPYLSLIFSDHMPWS